MPDGTRHTDPGVERCARLMTMVTRHWAELEASCPRDGPVRDAMSRLEPVVFAQMTLAMRYWVDALAVAAPKGPQTARLNRLALQIADPGDTGDPETGPPHLTSIDFVQLWPKVIEELREAG